MKPYLVKQQGQHVNAFSVSNILRWKRMNGKRILLLSMAVISALGFVLLENLKSLDASKEMKMFHILYSDETFGTKLHLKNGKWFKVTVERIKYNDDYMVRNGNMYVIDSDGRKFKSSCIVRPEHVVKALMCDIIHLLSDDADVTDVLNNVIMKDNFWTDFHALNP